MTYKTLQSNIFGDSFLENQNLGNMVMIASDSYEKNGSKKILLKDGLNRVLKVVNFDDNRIIDYNTMIGNDWPN